MKRPFVATSAHSQGGSNLTNVRAHNERLVLSLIRDQALSRAEIARLSALSPQTITLIIRALSEDGLITQGTPVRGRVGQPSVPLSLNPEGAYFYGLKIGRRSADLLLMNFMGNVITKQTIAYAYPNPDSILEFVATNLNAMADRLPSPQAHKRIRGLGIATPSELWTWGEQQGAPTEIMDRWRSFDYPLALSDITDLPVFVENDATTACGAELTFGRGREFTDFAYFFIGYFIGGGIVLNQSVHTGALGNAGAFGSLPVLDNNSPTGVAQLIDTASIYLLEQTLSDAQQLPTAQTNNGEDAFTGTEASIWQANSPALDQWVNQVGRSLAMSISSVCSVYDFEAIIIDGAFPPVIRTRIVMETQRQFDSFNTKGLMLPRIAEGIVGSGARELGAARLPLFARFLMDQSVLTKAMS